MRCEVVRRLPMSDEDIADLRAKLQVMNAALQAQAPEET